MQDESFPLPKIFRITRGWRTFLLICPLISVIWGIGAIWLMTSALHESKNMMNDIVIALLSLGMILLLLWLYFDYSKSRLVVDANGLIYYGSGFRVYTPWHNIIGFANASPLKPMSVSWTAKLIGLRLYQNARMDMTLEDGVRQGIAVIETDWWYPASMRAPYAGFFILDEIIRERNWQQGELGIYLRHYAPYISKTIWTGRYIVLD